MYGAPFQTPHPCSSAVDQQFPNCCPKPWPKTLSQSLSEAPTQCQSPTLSDPVTSPPQVQQQSLSQNPVPNPGPNPCPLVLHKTRPPNKTVCPKILSKGQGWGCTENKKERPKKQSGTQLRQCAGIIHRDAGLWSIWNWGIQPSARALRLSVHWLWDGGCVYATPVANGFALPRGRVGRGSQSGRSGCTVARGAHAAQVPSPSCLPPNSQRSSCALRPTDAWDAWDAACHCSSKSTRPAPGLTAIAIPP
mmetsp:Transcript_74654/g.125818  ORF Transcript_74654/g.125818 Transcript_74654/m.125818 type:complete len:249 (+) Transcript_74654:139-885(+)